MTFWNSRGEIKLRRVAIIFEVFLSDKKMMSRKGPIEFLSGIYFSGRMSENPLRAIDFSH